MVQRYGLNTIIAVVILSLFSCGIEKRTTTDLFESCERGNYKDIFSWTIERFSSISEEEIQSDAQFISFAINCLITQYKSLDSDSAEFDSIKFWLSQIESYQYSNHIVRKIGVLPDVYLANEIGFVDFYELGNNYLLSTNLGTSNAIDSLFSKYPIERFLGFYMDYEQNLSGEQISYVQKYNLLQNLLNNIQPYIQSYGTAAENDLFEKITVSREDEYNGLLDFELGLKAEKRVLESLQSEHDQFQNYKEETENAEQKLSKLKTEIDNARSDGIWLNGQIIKLVNQTSYGKLYECAFDNGKRFLLETVYTEFNSQGNFSLGVKMLADVEITTVNGFKQTWGKFREISEDEYVANKKRVESLRKDYSTLTKRLENIKRSLPPRLISKIAKLENKIAEKSAVISVLETELFKFPKTIIAENDYSKSSSLNLGANNTVPKTSSQHDKRLNNETKMQFTKNFKATPGQGKSINLTWVDECTFETGFKLERKTAKTPWVEIGVIDRDVTNFVDKDVNSGIEYSYRISALTPIVQSLKSSSNRLTLIMSKPSNLKTSGQYSSNINLEWTDNCEYESGFRVEQDSGAGFQVIAEVTSNTQSYIQRGLKPLVFYKYRVCAFTTTDTSDFSDIATAVILIPIEDVDGNQYETVAIGDQIWMSENLRTKHYRNGDSIKNIPKDDDWVSSTLGAYCGENRYGWKPEYGTLYNWYAVSDIRNIAPAGWHVPTDADWNKLEHELGITNETIDEFGVRGWNSVGSKLAGTQFWRPGALTESKEFGSSGFNAVPAGYRNSYSGTFYEIGSTCIYYTSTENNESNNNSVIIRSMDYNSVDFQRNPGSKNGAYSVRCVKD